MKFFPFSWMCGTHSGDNGVHLRAPPGVSGFVDTILWQAPDPHFLFFLFILFIYFWLSWVFVVVCGLSLVVVSGGYSSLRCAGFSLRWLLLLQSTGSRHVGFSSCGSQAQ